MNEPLSGLVLHDATRTPPADRHARRDLVTNPAYGELRRLIQEMVDKETHRLTVDASGQELARINRQAGVVEGLKRAVLALENHRAGVLAASREDGGQQPPDRSPEE